MRPWDFWRLTAAEFAATADGYRRRTDRELERLAWQTANLMNVHLKKKDRMTMQKLLGRVIASGHVTAKPETEQTNG